MIRKPTRIKPIKKAGIMTKEHLSKLEQDAKAAAEKMTALLKELGKLTGELIDTGTPWKDAYIILKNHVMTHFGINEYKAANFVRLCMNLENCRRIGQPLYSIEDCKNLINIVF